MHNDSIETVLARHYGSTAVAPADLEQRLQASVRRQAAEVVHEQEAVTRLHAHPVSRRRAIQLVAIGSVGLGLVNLGIEGLQALEASVMGQEATQGVATP